MGIGDVIAAGEAAFILVYASFCLGFWACQRRYRKDNREEDE